MRFIVIKVILNLSCPTFHGYYHVQVGHAGDKLDGHVAK